MRKNQDNVIELASKQPRSVNAVVGELERVDRKIDKLSFEALRTLFLLCEV